MTTKEQVKHTPGPWHTNIITGNGERDCQYPVYAGEAPNWIYVAHILSKNSADLNLIAAAPELLEACKQVSASADENVSIDLKKIHYAILQTLAAIAKAEGR